MKKALSLMTAAALVLSLAACGSTASSAASSEAVSSDAASSETASSEAASETETAELSTVEPGKLIMSTNAAFPPYEMTTDSGEFEGIDIETAQAIADKLGLELQIDDMDFDAALLSVQQGKADIVMAGVTVTDERKQSVDFSDAYAMAQLAILANADSGVASIDDLNQPGKKVTVKTGSTGDVYATKNLTNAEIVRLADESACVTEVVQGKADGFLYDQLTIYRNHQANPDTTEAVFIPFQDAEEWGIAVKKGNTELLDQLNAFIAQSKTDGEFDRLTEKYLADEKKAFDQYGFKWFFDFE